MLKNFHWFPIAWDLSSIVIELHQSLFIHMSIIIIIIIIIILFFFLRLHLLQDAPGPGIESELQLQAYSTAKGNTGSELHLWPKL